MMALSLRLLLVEDSLVDPAALLQALRTGGYAPCHTRVATAEVLRDALDAGPWGVVIAESGLSHWAPRRC